MLRTATVLTIHLTSQQPELERRLNLFLQYSATFNLVESHIDNMICIVSLSLMSGHYHGWATWTGQDFSLQQAALLSQLAGSLSKVTMC